MQYVKTGNELRKLVDTGYHNLRKTLEKAHCDFGLDKEEVTRERQQEYAELQERILSAAPGERVEFRHKDWPSVVSLNPDDIFHSKIGQGREGIVLLIPPAKTRELEAYFEAQGQPRPFLLRPSPRQIEKAAYASILQGYADISESLGVTSPIPVTGILHAGKADPDSVRSTLRKLRGALVSEDGREFNFRGLTISKDDFFDVDRTLWVYGESADAMTQHFAPGRSSTELAATIGVKQAVERMTGTHKRLG